MIDIRPSAFLSPLRCDILDDTHVRLRERCGFYSAILKRELWAPEGFTCDLASVPRLPGAYLLAGGRAKREAVFHDLLYRELLLGQRVADLVFLEALRTPREVWNPKTRAFETCTQPAWLRAAMFSAVRLGGWMFYPDKPPLPPIDTSTDSSSGD